MKSKKIFLGPIFFSIFVVFLTACGSFSTLKATNPTAASTPTVAPVTLTPSVTLIPTDQTAVAPSAGTKPTAVPVVAQGKQPPACTYPLANNSELPSKPENYDFSDPKIVLTDPDNLYDIVSWLPDNQQVLLTQDQYRTTDANNNDGILRQTIEIFNPGSGEVMIYAVRHHVNSTPAWEPGLNGIVYSDINVIKVDEKNHQTAFTGQLWETKGDPNNPVMLAKDLADFPLAIKPNGNSIIFLSGKNLSKMDISTKGRFFVPFDMAQWDYAAMRRDQNAVSYKMAWQPGTDLLFLYSNDGMQLNGGYTFVVNSTTGQVCEINLEGWVVKARWSSDGHYLSIIRSEFSFGPVDKTDLVVLDATTGKTYTNQVTPEEIKGRHFVDDFVWGPDNVHLLAVASTVPYQGPREEGTSGLYLLDFMSGESTQSYSSVYILCEYIPK